MRYIIPVLLLGLLPLEAQRPSFRDIQDRSKNLAPFVASPQPIVDRMLDLAAVKSGETVYDLGCGDGRILITAAQRFGARGVGIELSQKLVESANGAIRRQNLQDRVRVMQGNLLDADLKDADVVTLYLETGSNDILRPILEKQLKSGSRVVSHDFQIRGWNPVKVDKLDIYNRDHTIYLYQIPESLKKK
jgi:predicted RNA methylase